MWKSTLSSNYWLTCIDLTVNVHVCSTCCLRSKKMPKSWTVPFKIPARRPIVSDCGSQLYRVAKYIDYFLNPLAPKHQSYVKNTYDFVHKLSTLRVPADTFLFSINVESLYKYETDQGSVRSIFQSSSRLDAEILKLLKITLFRNNFEFNNKYYLQPVAVRWAVHIPLPTRTYVWLNGRGKPSKN